MLLWFCDVWWYIRILRWFKVWTPPVSNCVFYNPFLLHSILPSESLEINPICCLILCFTELRINYEIKYIHSSSVSTLRTWLHTFYYISRHLRRLHLVNNIDFNNVQVYRRLFFFKSKVDIGISQKYMYISFHLWCVYKYLIKRNNYCS